MIYDQYKDLPTGAKLPPNVIEAFKVLWEDGGVVECYRRSMDYQLNDSAP